MRRLLPVLRRQRRERPAATVLAALGACHLLVGSVLTLEGPGLLGQLLMGLALVPLSLATALFLLPARLWPDDHDEGGGPGRGDGGLGGPPPSGGPDGGVDWAGFEREFREYVEERRAVPA
jgi:hypothetical protein